MNNVPPADRVDPRVDQYVRVLTGALEVWHVAGTVAADPQEASVLLIDSDEGVHLAVHHDVAAGWTVSFRDPATGARTPLTQHAGLPALLRTLRTELAPHAPAGRLIVASA